MNNEHIITELLAMRVRLDEVIAALRTAETPANTNAVALTYMSLAQFMARWGISRSTLYTRIGEGLPVIGEGHGRRIKVVDGDDWMSKHTNSRKAG